MEEREREGHQDGLRVSEWIDEDNDSANYDSWSVRPEVRRHHIDHTWQLLYLEYQPSEPSHGGKSRKELWANLFNRLFVFLGDMFRSALKERGGGRLEKRDDGHTNQYGDD